jgi:hypothetical protein
VPLVRPEKYASAIEQKKTLAADTSLKGNVVETPPQLPTVSACNRVDRTVTLTINEMSRVVRIAKLVLILIMFSFGLISKCAYSVDAAADRICSTGKALQLVRKSELVPKR